MGKTKNGNPPFLKNILITEIGRVMKKFQNFKIKMEEDNSEQKDDQTLHDDNVFSNNQITAIIIDKLHVKVLCNKCNYAFNSGVHILEAIRQHFRLHHNEGFSKKHLSPGLETALLNYESTLPLPLPPIKCNPELRKGYFIFSLKTCCLINCCR